MKAEKVLGAIYNSISGNTMLVWRSIDGYNGKLVGKATLPSFGKLVKSGIY